MNSKCRVLKRTGRWLGLVGVPFFLASLACGCFSTSYLRNEASRTAPTAVHNPRQITTYLADELSPVVNPSGTALVYVSNQGGNRDLWIRPFSSGQPVRLTNHTADDFDPAFSPNGKQLAFASHRLDAKGDIFVMKIDGSGLTRLTDSQSADRQPVFFPDGRRLAFTSAPFGEAESIWSIDLESHARQRLSNRPGFDPAISPDGRYLLFTAPATDVREGSSCLWLRRLADGAERPLHHCDRPEAFGAWTQIDGRLWVVFARFADDTNQDGRIDMKDRPSLWQEGLIDWQGDVPRGTASVPLTNGASSDITPSVRGTIVYYASRTDEDLDIWAVPLLLSALPVLDCTRLQHGFEANGEPLEMLFQLRRAAAQSNGTAAGERCRLQEAELLLTTQRFAQAEQAFEQVAAEAQDDSVRRQAQVGLVAALLDQQLPVVGLSSRETAERTQRANMLLERLNAIPSSLSETVVVRADILQRVGRWSEALEQLERVLREQRSDTDSALRARLLYGEVLRAMGASAAALENLLVVLRVPECPAILAQEASQRVVALLVDRSAVLLSEHEPIERLERMAEIVPDLPLLVARLRLELGKRQRAAKKPGLARTAFGEAARHADAEPQILYEALLNLSTMAEEDGDQALALDTMNELQSRLPAEGVLMRSVHRRMRRLGSEHAAALLMHGESGMAIKIYRQIVAQDPNDLAAQRQLIALLAEHGQAAEAVEIYNQRAHDRPGDDLALYLKGLALTYLDPPRHLNQAQAALEESLSINSQQTFAHQTLGWIFEQRGRTSNEPVNLQKAAEEYEAALSLLDARAEPRSEADLLLNLGTIHYALGNYKQAYTFYKHRAEKPIAVEPAARRFLWYTQFGRSAFMSDALDDAREAFEHAIALAEQLKRDTELPQVLLSLGAVLSLASHHARAADTFERACRLYSEQGRWERLAICRRNVALSRYQNGEYAAAGREFAAAHDLLQRFGIGGVVERGVSVGIGSGASQAALGFDRDDEQKLLFTFQSRLWRDSGDLKRAQEYLEHAIDLLDRKLTGSPNEAAHLNMALAQNQLGSLHSQVGDTARAATLFEESAAHARIAGSYEGVVLNDLNRLSLLLTEHTIDPAMLARGLAADWTNVSQQDALSDELKVRLQNGVGVALLAAARSVDQQRARPGTLAERIRLVLHDIDSAGETVAQAQQAFQQACQRARGLSDRAGARLAVGACWNWADVLSLRGHSQKTEQVRAEERTRLDDLALIEERWRLGDPGGSDLRRAELLLQLPSVIAGTDSNVLAVYERDHLFSALVDAALQRHDTDSAFTWAERWRARRRLDGFAPNDLIPASDSERKYLTDLNERQRVLQRALQDLTPTLTPNERVTASAQVQAALQEFNRFREQEADIRPAWRRLFSVKVPSSDDVRATLDPGEGLLLITALTDRSVAWLFSRERVWTVVIPLGAQKLRHEVALLRDANPTTADAARHSLAVAVLKPLEEPLATLRSLVVVSDAMELPLSVLPWKGQALCHSLPMSQIGSASELIALRAARNLNLQPGLWVSVQAPPAALVSDPETPISLHWFKPNDPELPNALQQPNLIVWDSAPVIDPLRPLRSTLVPASPNGALEEHRLAQLGGIAQKSALWLLTGAPEGFRSGLPAVGFEFAMESAGVPSAILLPEGADGRSNVELIKGLLRRLVDQSPAEALAQVMDEALSHGVSWQALLGVQLRGDPGLNAAARVRHAEQRIGLAVQSAMQAFAQKQWQPALAGFLEVRALAQYLNRLEVLPKIDQGIVQSAFQLADFEQALEYQQKIVERAVRTNEKLGQARARVLLGVVLSRLERHKDAVTELLVARSLFDEINQKSEAAQATATLAVAQDAAADYTASVNTAQDALQRFRTIKDDVQELRLLRMLGATYLKRLNLLDTARTWFEEALQKSRAVKDDRQGAAVLLDIARTELAAGTFEQAVRTVTVADEIYRRLQDQRGQAEAALERAHGMWYLAEYQQALNAQRQALSFAQQAGEVRLIIMARSLGGLIALNLGDLPGAEQALQQALEEAHRAGLSDEEAVQLNNLGSVARERGDMMNAVDYFQKALAIDQTLKNKRGRAYDLRNLGITEQMLGGEAPADEHLQVALTLSREVGDGFNEVKVLQGLAQLELEQKRFDEASDHARAALDLSTTLGVREVQWRALRTQGQIAQARGQTATARERYQKAIAVVEQMRAALTAEEFSSGFLDNKYDLYEDMVHLLLDLGQGAEAFAYAERARGRGFLDLLANRQVSVGGAANRQKLEELERQRHAMQTLSENVRRASAAERDRAMSEFERAEKQYQQQLSELRLKQPDAADLFEVQTVTLADLQTRLPADVVLIAYFVTRTDTVAWVVGAKQLSAQRLALPRQELRQIVNQVRQQLENFAPADQGLMHLYEELVQPLQADLQGARTIGIIPHDVLNYLPYAALKPTANSYLADRVDLFVNPSASVLALLLIRQTQHPKGNGNLLVLGNPDLGDRRLMLPFSEHEAIEVGLTRSGSSVYLGEAASESTLRARIGQSEFVHLACHGSFNVKSPLKSAIRLAAGGGQDGDVTALEVFELSLAARLVTLSGCQTGLTGLGRGDEIIGLVRAFLTAGANGVLATLWRVSDLSSAVLMKRFYRSLTNNSPLAALRHAQQVVRQYFPHPAYWAAFMLVGTWE